MLNVKFYKKKQILTERNFSLNYDEIISFIDNHTFDYTKAHEAENLKFDKVVFESEKHKIKKIWQAS